MVLAAGLKQVARSLPQMKANNAMLALDHIAVGTAQLKAGQDELKRCLGVEVPLGGKHPTMATHNAVMRASFQPAADVPAYFELIASDPDAPRANRPRWFSLDDPATKARLSKGLAPLCWVVRCTDLEAKLANLPAPLRKMMGPAIAMSRGDLSWRLTVPTDGSLAMGGLLPVLIEWPPGPHISLNQADLGVSIQKIELMTAEPAILQSYLDLLGVSHLTEVKEGATQLCFTLDSPAGTTKMM